MIGGSFDLRLNINFNFDSKMVLEDLAPTLSGVICEFFKLRIFFQSITQSCLVKLSKVRNDWFWAYDKFELIVYLTHKYIKLILTCIQHFVKKQMLQRQKLALTPKLSA